MKLTKPECIALTVTGLTLTAMLFYTLGIRMHSQPVELTVSAVNTSSVEVEISASENTAQTTTTSPDVESVRKSLVNINTAVVDDLITLPGIGEERAKAIVRYRVMHGAFTSVEDLKEVDGIGDGIMEQIRDYVTIGETIHG